MSDVFVWVSCVGAVKHAEAHYDEGPDGILRIVTGDQETAVYRSDAWDKVTTDAKVARQWG